MKNSAKGADVTTYKRINKPSYASRFVEFIKTAGGIAAVIGMVVSRASLLGCMSPFSIAWYAATAGIEKSSITVLACMVGVFLSGMGALRFKYIASLFVFWVLRKYCETERWNDIRFSALIASSVTFLCGFTITAITGFIYYNLLICTVEALAVFFVGIIFDKTKNILRRGGRVINDDESIAVAILAGVVVAGLQGISIYGINPANILSMYIILFSAYKGGVGISGAVGAALGIISGMSQGNMPALTGVYAFVGLTAGVLRMFGKTGICIAAVCANALFAAYYNASTVILINIVEIAVAAALFFFTSSEVFDFLEKYSIKSAVHDESASVMLRIKNNTDEIFDRIKLMLGGVKSAFEVTYHKEETHGVEVLCDRLSSRVCSGCNLNRYCWTRNCKGTEKMFSGIIKNLFNENETELLKTVSGKCVRGETMVNTALEIYDIYKREYIVEEKAKRCAKQIFSKWDSVLKLLETAEEAMFVQNGEYDFEAEKISKNVRPAIMGGCDVSVSKNDLGRFEVAIKTQNEFTFDVSDIVAEAVKRDMYILDERPCTDGYITRLEELEDFCFEAAVVTMDNSHEEISGDNGKYFFVRGGFLYCVICDGMGSGYSAAHDSGAVVNIFEKLAKCGMELEDIVKTINTGLISADGNERCISLDCAKINLFTGVIELIKAGGAATVVKNGDVAQIIGNTTMPLGILAIDEIDKVYTKITDDGYLVMMTDGVPDNRGMRDSGEEFVKNVVALNGEVGAKELADSVLMSAITDGCPKDDMLVMVIKLYRR